MGNKEHEELHVKEGEVKEAWSLGAGRNYGTEVCKGGEAHGPPWTSYDPAVPWRPAIPFSAVPRDSVVDP